MLEMHFDVLESGFDFKTFGFATSPSGIYSRQDEELNLEFAGGENTAHGSATVYAYWIVSSVESFDLEISGVPLSNGTSVWDWNGSWNSRYGASDEIMEISADDSYAAKVIYSHNPSSNISSRGSVEIKIDTEDTDVIHPGLYSGTLTLGIKGE